MTLEELEAVISDVLTRAMPLDMKVDTIMAAARFYENQNRSLTSDYDRSTRNIDPDGRPAALLKVRTAGDPAPWRGPRRLSGLVQRMLRGRQA